MERARTRKTILSVIMLALAGTVMGTWASSITSHESAPQSNDLTTTSTVPTSSTLPTPDPSPGTGVVDKYQKLGRVEIPAINVRQSLLRGVTLKTFDYGVGWWPGTAVPGGYGNMVLGGHRTTAPKPFRYLDRLKPGDEIIVTTDDGRFVYSVRETQIVDDTALWIVDQAPGFTATLFACHPVGSTAQRIVVFADLERTPT